MRRRVLVLVAALAALLVVPLDARAQPGDPPCPPGKSPDPSGLVCVFVDKQTTGIDAQTQQAQTEQAVAAQESGWLGQALELQHRLGDALPLTDAMWVGTHNSFNTVSNVPPSLSNLDSNQHVSLVDQLRLGVRGIEIDVHWNPSVWAGGAKAPVVCHARPPSQLNAGCTDERLLPDELAPVSDWLRAPEHRRDVILLYLEDNIDEAAGYEASAAAISQTIGDLVYAPPAGHGCELLPMTLRRADVLAAHKQVVVMSGCGGAASTASQWRSTVFDDSVRAEDGNPTFAGYPACTSGSVTPADYGTKLVRFFEDSTFVSAATSGGDPGHRFTVDGLRDMVRCGVNLFGLDQLDPSDPRLVAMVWSWAPNEPATASNGTCVVDAADGRFHTAPCRGAKRPFACVDVSGEWFVSSAAGFPGAGMAACRTDRPSAVFAVPGSGGHAQRLNEAKAAAGVSEAWVSYQFANGAWSANAR
jgi:hypothetical protein